MINNIRFFLYIIIFISSRMSVDPWLVLINTRVLQGISKECWSD